MSPKLLIINWLGGLAPGSIVTLNKLGIKHRRDFRAAARGFGCENPTDTIAQEQARQQSWSYRGVILLVVTLTVLAVVWCQQTAVLSLRQARS